MALALRTSDAQKARQGRAAWKAYDYSDRLHPGESIRFGPRVLAPPTRPHGSQKKTPAVVREDDAGA